VLRPVSALLIILRSFSNFMINCLLLTIIAVVIYDFMPIGLVVQIIDVGFLVEWKLNLSLLNVLPVRARFELARL